MRNIQKIGLSCLFASAVFSGCSEESKLDTTNDVDRIARWVSDFNGTETNGNKLNGNKLNGNKLNGNKLNGTTVQTVQNIATDHGQIVGYVLESGATITGPNFQPIDLIGVLEDGTQGPVRVVDYQVVHSAGLPDTDSYLVVNPDTGESVCGRDDSNNPIYAVPMAAAFDQNTGVRVSRPDLFTFACRFAALEKCNEYGYPDWQTRTESYSSQNKTRSLSLYHDTCVRMVRADYCGDGQPHTYNGTLIDIYDNLSFNTIATSTNGSDGYYFEAEWGVDGAWCIQKTRWMPLAGTTIADNNNRAINPDWAYIEDHCPERIAGHAWTNSPYGGTTPRPCGGSASYNASVGFGLTDQSQRGLLRNNSQLYRR